MSRFEFDEQFDETLNSLRRDKSEDKGAVLRRAVALLKVAQEGVDHGDRLFLISAETRQEIDLGA